MTDKCRPEQVRQAAVECAQAETIGEIQTKLNKAESEIASTKATADQTLAILTDLHKKLLVNNGSPAIIPAMQNQIAEIKRDMIPHDKMHDVVKAVDIGTAIIFYLVIAAIVGGAALAFWHLFTLNTHVNQVAIPKVGV